MDDNTLYEACDLRTIAETIDRELRAWIDVRPTDSEGRYNDAVKHVAGIVMRMTLGRLDPRFVRELVDLHRVPWHEVGGHTDIPC